MELDDDEGNEDDDDEEEEVGVEVEDNNDADGDDDDDGDWKSELTPSIWYAVELVTLELFEPVEDIEAEDEDDDDDDDDDDEVGWFLALDPPLLFSMYCFFLSVNSCSETLLKKSAKNCCKQRGSNGWTEGKDTINSPHLRA